MCIYSLVINVSPNLLLLQCWSDNFQVYFNSGNNLAYKVIRDEVEEKKTITCNKVALCICHYVCIYI